MSVYTYIYNSRFVCILVLKVEKVDVREREREKEKRNSARDNNHNNLVKRYKDISR